MKKYDVIVIGSGSANIIVDEAILHNKSVAMIEMGKFGGTCLTRGCIPTKVMVSVADFIRESEHIKKIGIEVKDISVDFETVKKRVWQKIDTESIEVKDYYEKQKNVTIYEGVAKFLSDKQIKVIFNDDTKQDEIITADTIVIGAGARTKAPKIDGLEDLGYVTSETFFGEKFPQKPYKSLTIIGGGYIGMEFAHIFSALGSEVSVVQHNKFILPREEKDICEKAYNIFSSYGINIYTNKDTIRVYEEDGQKVLEIKDIDSGKTQYVKSEEIIVASGVMSNADTLDIKNTNIMIDKRGYIKTNEFLQTNVEGIYAIGDINGMYQFRHKANYEAEVLAYNLFDAVLKKEDEKYDLYKHHEAVSYISVPAVTYTFPQVAHVGLTVDELKKNNYPNEIEIAVHNYSDTAKGYSLGYDKDDMNDGYVKIIRDKKTKKILGVHAIGYEASLLIQPYVELLNSEEIVFEIINDDIQSELTRNYRNNSDFFAKRKSNTTNLTDRTMVAHPSLSEVSMWTKYMNFK